MINFEECRRNMVESQLRPNKVTDEKVLLAMGSIPREVFAGTDYQGIAYVDEDISLGDGRYLMEPMVLARLLQAAEEGPFKGKTSGVLQHDIVRSPQEYYDIFAPLTADIDIWETEYAQILEGDDPVFNWVSGTALRPVMGVLDEDEQAAFAKDYKAALNQAYPKRADGKTLFPFKRIFMVVGV